ncbi:MAG: hypothetical protein QF535_00305 [Anaerolineales bacterium]|nr:hypothetical protein [Anaerolineales bacterium]
MAEIRVKETGTIKLFESDNTSSVTIASPASLGADRTITLPDASVTLASGTMLATDGSGASLTSLNASELGSGTVPTARLGSGTASSSTVLYGDQTYKAEPGGGILLKREVTGVTALTTVTGTSTTSYTDTGLTASITTSETDSTVTCEFSQFFATSKSATSIAIGFVKLLVDYDGAGYAQASGNLWGAYLYEGITTSGRLRGPGSLCGAWTTPTKPSGTVVSFKTQFYLYNIDGSSASIYAQSDYMRSTMILTELSTT